MLFPTGMRMASAAIAGGVLEVLRHLVLQSGLTVASNPAYLMQWEGFREWAVEDGSRLHSTPW